MVRTDLVGVKIARATAWLDDAAPVFGRSRKEFVANPRERDLAAFYLFLAIQECIDIAAHWVADEGWAPPDDAASCFDVLADRAVIDRDLAEGMRSAAGLRNRIAHGYALVDHDRLHRESASGLPLIRQFLATLASAAGV